MPRLKRQESRIEAQQQLLFPIIQRLRCGVNRFSFDFYKIGDRLQQRGEWKENKQAEKYS